MGVLCACLQVHDLACDKRENQTEMLDPNSRFGQDHMQDKCNPSKSACNAFSLITKLTMDRGTCSTQPIYFSTCFSMSSFFSIDLTIWLFSSNAICLTNKKWVSHSIHGSL